MARAFYLRFMAYVNVERRQLIKCSQRIAYVLNKLITAKTISILKMLFTNNYILKNEY